MDRVRHIDPLSDNTFRALAKAMKQVGVLGAGRFGRATSIMVRMFKDPACFTYLAMAGPMVPGGLRTIISHLISAGLVDAIVTSGANIVHDLIEAYGGAHYRLLGVKDDYELRRTQTGRIADIYVSQKDFETLEKCVYAFLDSLPDSKRTTMAPSEFLSELGSTINDEHSIVRQAHIHNVPIFSPGLMDSMLGFHLFTYSTMTKFSLDFVKDLRILASILTEKERVGAIMLGGGIPKHFAMGSTILKGGLDLAIQITLDRPEGGSLSGAPLMEGISWQKLRPEASHETIIGDATIIFPFLVLSAISEL